MSVAVDENLVEIVAENANKGYSGAAGIFTAKEDETLVLESTLKEKTNIVVKFAAVPQLGIDDDPAKVLAGNGVVLEISVTGPVTEEYELPAGDYMVHADALGKSDGKIVIRVK